MLHSKDDFVFECEFLLSNLIYAIYKRANDQDDKGVVPLADEPC